MELLTNTQTPTSMFHHSYDITILNTSALAITTFDMDAFLKTSLLLLTIGYTIFKWYQDIKAKKEEKCCKENDDRTNHLPKKKK